MDLNVLRQTQRLFSKRKSFNDLERDRFEEVYEDALNDIKLYKSGKWKPSRAWMAIPMASAGLMGATIGTAQGINCNKPLKGAAIGTGIGLGVGAIIGGVLRHKYKKDMERMSHMNPKQLRRYVYRTWREAEREKDNTHYNYNNNINWNI